MIQLFERNKTETWPSSLADDGVVRWSTVEQDAKGHISISFPHIRRVTTDRGLLWLMERRWENVRSFEGWSALQHHALAHTTIKISPPPISARTATPEFPRWLAVKTSQLAFFAVTPTTARQGFVPEWHAGNIYGFAAVPTQLIELPSWTENSPLELHVWVSAEYEASLLVDAAVADFTLSQIRLFGDPLSTNSTVPVIEIDFTVELEPSSKQTVLRAEQFDVVPDWVDGYPTGEVLAIGLRAGDRDCEILGVESISGVRSAVKCRLVRSNASQRHCCLPKLRE